MPTLVERTVARFPSDHERDEEETVPTLDFENRQSLDKMLHAYSVRQVMPDGDMEVYLVILATVKAPAEIWKVVPEELKSGLRNLVETSIEYGPNKRAFVGGAFESYWSHAAAERWHQFFQQTKAIFKVKDVFEIKDEYATGHTAGLVVVFDFDKSKDFPAKDSPVTFVNPSGVKKSYRVAEVKEHGTAISIFLSGAKLGDVKIGDSLQLMEAIK